MNEVRIKLIKKEEVAEGTMAFHFEKPEGFEFQAGQFADFTLINPPEADAEGNRRAFSFVHSSDEGDLMFTTRMRDSAFKRVLKNLSLGAELKMDGPYGSYVLHKTESTPAVFLIGGIGITPVRSIISDATYRKLPHKITLFYSNKTPEDTAFLEDFNRFAKENSNLTFVPVMTRSTEEEWQGERGHINAEMIKKYVPDAHTPIYYISGPKAMVATMREILTDLKVNEDNIRTEQFSGY